MKILILGSEGQIGKPLFDYLNSKGHEIRGWDKKIDSSLDLSIESNFDNLRKDIRWSDKVYFLAFEVGGSKFLENTDNTFDYISENVRLMDLTFDALRLEDKPYIFASSQMSNMHHTNYGFLKDLGERYVRSMSNGWICRFWNVYGYENPSDPKSHVITDFINMAKNGNILMRTTGEEKRQFLYVDDCVEALEQWAEGKWDNQSKYYDITTFEWVSIETTAKIIQSKIPCGIIKGMKKDSIQRGIENPPDGYIKKFWSSKISLEEGIGKLI